MINVIKKVIKKYPKGQRKYAMWFANLQLNLGCSVRDVIKILKRINGRIEKYKENNELQN